MRKQVSIIGGGAAALMLACELDPMKYEVRIYEKNKQPGRKFLVAGDGGFNLTHSENESAFIQRYSPHEFLEPAFAHFSNKHLMAWLQQLGISTYTGSSGRVFPVKGLKPIDVLEAFLKRLKDKGVALKTAHEWLGFCENGDLLFEHEQKKIEVKSDVVIFCLGGASWPVTGSNGKWPAYFIQKNVVCQPFEASNCAFQVNWPEVFISQVSGQALKNISLRCQNKIQAGEVVITNFGLEGSGIYPLSPQIREELKKTGSAKIFFDLKPALSTETILNRIQKKGVSKNLSERLKQELNLNSLQVKLLKSLLTKEEFTDINQLCANIKNLEISISGLAPIDEAISTVGGIDLEELDAHFQLKKIPNQYCIGEMLNYDAPTGGYLLQSCFSMAAYLAYHFNSNSD